MWEFYNALRLILIKTKKQSIHFGYFFHKILLNLSLAIKTSLMKKITFLTTAFMLSFLANAQVLFSEDFNSYPAGHLNTDYTGTTAGQGGWLTTRHPNSIATAMVTPETSKGNVITFTSTGNFSNEYAYTKQNTGIIDGLWNNRTAGNNVLKMEYEVYGVGFYYATGGIINLDFSLMGVDFVSTNLYLIRGGA